MQPKTRLVASAAAPRHPPADRPIAGVGVGLRTHHIGEVLRSPPALPWLELLADNHLAEGGLDRARTDALCDRFPVALHCVSMNLGGCDPLDFSYLARIRELHKRTGARWVSDHLCFTAVEERAFHDLLPIPYTREALRHVTERVQRVQDFLGGPILVENISAYLRYREGAYSEPRFLAELCSATGCGLLLDVNNLYVNQVNHGEDALAAIEAMPLERVGEIHLGGYEDRGGWLLDAHNNRVSEPVWALFAQVRARLPDVPVLIEWDNDIPELAVLLDEARRARCICDRARAAA